ncbi:MAG: cytochrome d ubiquinol oxidase subunit II [Deltaproteobacteria bacterium]|nr:cytochrome d ubiquinol oxidase subunit II [Deltaproteobacteria bacterium]
MIGSLSTQTLQQIWWFICSIVGSLFIFLTFVQGGQTLLWQTARTKMEKDLFINSLGRKWEITFTTLVLFGGAMFAAFPKFYATSFGGAYWLWMFILFTFIIQAVSYEYRTKPDNFLGSKTYEFFLLINGSLGILLIGVVVGTFFTGAAFQLNRFNLVTWTVPTRGLEAISNPFNLALGLFLVFNARVLGAMYLLNNIDFQEVESLERKLRRAVIRNFIISLPFLLYVLISLITMDGFGVNAAGAMAVVPHKYLNNLIANPLIPLMLLAGLALVIAAVLSAARSPKKCAIWLGGTGTILVGLAIFCTAGYNHTSFYPSVVDLKSSLTIYNASSSHYTLTVMTYVALLIPVVLAYVGHVWHAMDLRKLSVRDIKNQYSDLY